MRDLVAGEEESEDINSKPVSSFGAVMMVTASFAMAATAKAVEKLLAGARRPAERTAP